MGNVCELFTPIAAAMHNTLILPWFYIYYFALAIQLIRALLSKLVLVNQKYQVL